MNLATTSDGILQVTGLERLSASNCQDFKQRVQPYLTANLRVMEIDCTSLRFIDSDGFGILIAIHKNLAAHAGHLRLRQPLPVVRQLLQMLRFDELFEITS